MADNIINITDVSANGVVIDTPPISLASNIFTDVKNVRFKDNAIRKMEGELLLNNIAEDLVPANEKFGKIRHVEVWEHPTLQPDGCFYIWVVDYLRDDIRVGQKVYAQDHLGNQVDITPPLNMVSNAVETTANAASGSTDITVADPSGIVIGDYIECVGIPKGTRVTNIVGSTITINNSTFLTLSSAAIKFGLLNGFTFTDTGWHSTLFNGGFSFIINNGIEKPHYINDNGGSGLLTDLILAELPGWDGEFVNERSVITTHGGTGVSDVFNIGRLVNFDISSVEVTVAGVARTVQAGNPAGTGTPNNVGFVPGQLPAISNLPSIGTTNFQIYNDKASNQTVIYIGNLTKSNDILVTVNSRNRVDISCGIIASFGALLVAGDITEKDENGIYRKQPGLVRTSSIAVPGALPSSWEVDDETSTSNDFVISESSLIKDMVSLQGNLYIYSSNSISQMSLTDDSTDPIAFSPVTDEYGTLTRGGIVEYDGKHFVIGKNDIYLFAGNPGDIQSVSDSRVRDYFFNNLNPIHEQKLFTLLNHRENEIWICYPTLASIEGECDEALIWNYRDNTWTIRELNNVSSGAIGPIKGGGIPTARLALQGNSGNAGYTNVGKHEVQEVTITGSTPKPTVGTKAIVEIHNSFFSDFSTDFRDVQEITIPYNSGNNNTGPVANNAVATLAWGGVSSPTFRVSGTSNQAWITFNGNRDAFFPQSSAATTYQLNSTDVFGTGLPLQLKSLNDFLYAARDYINDPNYDGPLSDWTASVVPNGGNGNLVLTSDVPGSDRTFSNVTFVYFPSQNPSSTSNFNATETNDSVNGGTAAGVYGVSLADSPAIGLKLRNYPTTEGLGDDPNYIFAEIEFDKNITTQQGLIDDILPKIQAIPQFNGDSNSLYSVSSSLANSTSDLKLIFTATTGGPRPVFGQGGSFLYTKYQVPTGGTTYAVGSQFGADLGTVTVATTQTGIDNGIPLVNLEVTFPDGSTSSLIIEGNIKYSLSTNAGNNDYNITERLNTIINASSAFTSSSFVNPSFVRATHATVGPINPFGISVTPLYSGSFPNDFSSSMFTQPAPPYQSVRAGRAAHSVTDRIKLIPPLGAPITVDFDSTAAFDPDSGSSPTNVEEITSTEIATKIQEEFGVPSGTLTTTVLRTAGGVIIQLASVAGIKTDFLRPATISGPGLAPGTEIIGVSEPGDFQHPNIQVGPNVVSDIPAGTTLTYTNHPEYSHFTVSRVNNVLTFTSVNRLAVAGEFSYTVVNGDVRTGTLVTPLIADSTGSDISVTTEGIDAVYAKMTRVTITLQTSTGDSVIWDKHYGEGPGRLLDPEFTPAQNDNTYGDTGVTNNASYLALYYNPSGDPLVENSKPNGAVVDTLIAMQQALSELSTLRNIDVIPDDTVTPQYLDVSPTQFGLSGSFVKSFSPATQLIDASVAPATASLIAVSEGTLVPATSPAQSTTGTSINTTLDLVRPWANNKINPTNLYPIFAQFYYDNNIVLNRLRAGDLGFDFDGTNYISYFEREQISITPTFNTETVESISLWADGGTITTSGGDLQRATLQVRARGTNYPGEKAFLTSPVDDSQSDSRSNKLVINEFVVSSEYKVDVRSQGRFINFRVDDAVGDTSNGYLANNNKGWNISGLQLRATQGGVK